MDNMFARNSRIFHTRFANTNDDEINKTVTQVTLAGFQATKIERQVLLRWTTTAETNTDYFEVQRSADGKRWTALGRVAAAKESTALQPYLYTDKTPNQGENLYRLKMVDQNETFTYSRIQNVSFDESIQLASYPNPVSNRLFFTQGFTLFESKRKMMW